MKQLFALLVSPPEPEVLIRRLEDVNVKSLVAFSCADAYRALERDVTIDLVLTGMKLPGGAWYDLVRAVAQKRPSPPLALCLPQIDGGWIDLLERGASAVVAPNYDCGTLQRLVAAVRAGGNATPDESQFHGSADAARPRAVFHRGPSVPGKTETPAVLRNDPRRAQASCEAAPAAIVGTKARTAWHARGGAMSKRAARRREGGLGF